MTQHHFGAGRTASLRRQHDAALDIVAIIQDATRHYSGDKDAYALAINLSKLTGLLRIHFAQEDKTLYPYMMTSANAEAAAVAWDFQKEMGDIGPQYDAFSKRWTSSVAIARAFGEFKAESAAIFAALGHRITCENERLYPLADSIRHDEVARTA